MTRRTRSVGAAVVIIALVLIGALGASRALLGDATAGALGAPRFVDETVASGLDHRLDDGYTASIGGGVAVLDCDDDGSPGPLPCGWCQPGCPVPERQRGGRSAPVQGHRGSAPRRGGRNGAYPIDIDGDGHVDLAVLRVGGIDLLRGLGDCRFERANDAWSFAGPGGWATAFSATWEASDRMPTLAIGKYLRLDASGEPTFECDRNVLFRPATTGTGFGPAIPLDPGYCALSMLFSDWDGSGRRDLRVSNDRQYYDFEHGEEQLWRMLPDRQPRLYGAGRRLGADADLGHGDREPGRDRGRPARGLPDQPGRQQAPDAAGRTDPTDLSRHRAQARGDRHPPVRG